MTPISPFRSFLYRLADQFKPWQALGPHSAAGGVALGDSVLPHVSIVCDNVFTDGKITFSCAYNIVQLFHVYYNVSTRLLVSVLILRVTLHRQTRLCQTSNRARGAPLPAPRPASRASRPRTAPGPARTAEAARQRPALRILEWEKGCCSAFTTAWAIGTAAGANWITPVHNAWDLTGLNHSAVDLCASSLCINRSYLNTSPYFHHIIPVTSSRCRVEVADWKGHCAVSVHFCVLHPARSLTSPTQNSVFWVMCYSGVWGTRWQRTLALQWWAPSVFPPAASDPREVTCHVPALRWGQEWQLPTAAASVSGQSSSCRAVVCSSRHHRTQRLRTHRSTGMGLIHTCILTNEEK